ncbi:uncharacterized protein LOC123313370 [Coccinella septempunctata]|uniref:uncharacterized protein LOC123313370 n=1 Tax=Coccinella septempunctata TaxID=41139 RepID=UPI001D06F54D|nr:uncharacterized protein LOC123313370 [Coccinella septempunctata]
MLYRAPRHVEILLLLLCWFDYHVRGEEYLVNSEKCKIPSHEPFNNETIGLWFPETYKSCVSKPLLTRVKKINNKATLHIEEHLLPLYGKNVVCCLANILREVDDEFPDDKIRWSECKLFKQNVALESNAVIVFCRDESGEEVYKNTHYVIKKTEKTKPKNNKNLPPISVLFIVIDSVSRLNFIRTMPKSRNYLAENGFVEMKGYNKIDDNTFPNFVALLTGLNKQQTREIHCTGRKIDELNNCPMIWYNFSSAGYATAYGEDWGTISTFNFFKKGFTKAPTDFYLRPYVLASEAIGTIPLKGAPYCAGPETSAERQLDAALDFAKTFKHFPYFGVFWMNTFSHQALNTPHRFDEKIRQFFTNLKAEGVLDDSVVILLSDHGIRLDPTIRRTTTGWFEERLPMNLISVPKWFRNRFPSEFNNLKLNSDKMTTTYDLYMTLQHILNLSFPDYKISPSSACPKCASLFNQIPPRTCSEAGVPQEWCTCIGHLLYLNPTDPIVSEGTQFVLDHIKSELTYYNYSQTCHDLQLFRVKKAALSERSEIQGKKYLFINFVATPFAEFIVTLLYQFEQERTQRKFILLLDPIRLDKGNNSCIPLSSISPYCNCKDEKNTKKTTPSV